MPELAKIRIQGLVRGMSKEERRYVLDTIPTEELYDYIKRSDRLCVQTEVKEINIIGG